MLDLLLSTVGQGLQWSILALGVFLSFLLPVRAAKEGT